MTGTIRLAAALALLLLARPTAAQLTTAEVYQRIDIAVSVASGAGGGASDSYKLPPTTIPVSGTGGETLPLKVVHANHGGIADASVFVSWSISPTGINASAELTDLSTATIPDSAASGFDQSFRVSFQVGAPKTYRLTGSPRTTTQLEATDRLTCAFNQTPMAGADPTTLPPSAEVPLEREGLVYPGETANIDCGVIGSTAFTDSANQRWAGRADPSVDRADDDHHHPEEGVQAGLQAGEGGVQGRLPRHGQGEARMREGLQEAREAVRAVDGMRVAGGVLSGAATCGPPRASAPT